jgi:DNA-binding response OmpR family regulator
MDVKKLKYKILIIDDEPQLVESIAVRLKASGYVVQTASDGVNGINKFKEEPPDLVILDIMMPGLSGLNVLRELKQLNSRVPVIMLTAYGTPQSAIEALKLGAYDHLSKPFNTEALLEMIKKALEKSV